MKSSIDDIINNNTLNKMITALLSNSSLQTNAKSDDLSLFNNTLSSSDEEQTSPDLTNLYLNLSKMNLDMAQHETSNNQQFNSNNQADYMNQSLSGWKFEKMF